MITDFKTYTNVGLRHITYNGVDSLTNHGILIADGTTVASVTPRSVVDTIPQRQGAIDGSRINGELFYEPRTLSYRFKIFADTRAELATKEAAVKAWLNSTGTYRIADSDYAGYEFVNCVLKGITVEPGEYKSAEYMYLTAAFTCDPYMQKAGTSRQRLTTWTALGNTARIVIDNQHLYAPTWLEVPSTPSNTVLTFLVNSTAEQQSNRSFYIFGIPSGVTVEDVYIVRQSQTITGEVTMRSPERGTLGSVEEDDMVVITYSGDITAAVAVGGVGAASATYSIANPLYRLNTLTEGTPTLKVNGETKALNNTFTLPATALMAITNSGYGYYELWHDTTEVRL